MIEKETGQPVSYADWAKAAKTDTGTLSRLLIHGQYCRDQLVQCTRPLVIFLVKKYRGLGIGPDDLVQVIFILLEKHFKFLLFIKRSLLDQWLVQKTNRKNYCSFLLFNIISSPTYKLRYSCNIIMSK